MARLSTRIFDACIRLRNWIVHDRPKQVGHDLEEPNLSKALRSRNFASNALMKGQRKRVFPEVAGSDCGDGSSITAGVELGHGGFGEVAAVGDLPFVVHVGQHGADEADDGGLVGEDPDHPGAAFDLFVHPLKGIGGPDLSQ